MISGELKALLINLKYSFHKYYGWRDAWHSVSGEYFYEGSGFDVYIGGRRYNNVKFTKLRDEQNFSGCYPWIVEIREDYFFYIVGPDMILYKKRKD